MAEAIRAGSINLANYMPETHSRAVAIGAAIDTMNLDVIGFQETEEWLEDKLVGLLSGSWTVVSDHVNCPVMVRSNRFDRLRWKGLTSLQFDMPGSVRKRYGSCAMVKRKSDGFTFVVASIHPSNSGESKNSAKDRIAQAEYVWNRFVEWDVLSFPILLLGDMNAREWSPQGLPGVFVGNGMIDVLAHLNAPVSIDRAFVYGLTPTATSLKTVANTLSDHPFRLVVVQPNAITEPEPIPEPDPEPLPDEEPPPGPIPVPPPETTLERLDRTLGPLKQFSVSEFELARKNGYLSQHVAVMQNYLNRETTCLWSVDDQKAYDQWRQFKYPKWTESRYTGPTDYESVTLLTFVAKRNGKKTHPVVR